MKKRSTTRQSLALFWRFTKPRKLSFWIGTVGAAIGIIVQDILPPVIIAAAFDRLQASTQSGQAVVLAEFTPYIYGYMGLLVAGIFIWRTQVWFVWHYEIHAMRDLAVHTFDHLQKMGHRFHANRFGGALVSQTNKLISAYEKVMDEFTWNIVTNIVAFTGSLIVLSITAPVYAVVFVITSTVYFVVMYYRTMRTMHLDRALASSESQRTAKLADMITNVSAVNSYAGESHERKLFEKQADETSRHYFALLRRIMVNDAMSHVMTNGISVLAFATGIFAITTLNQPAGVLFLAVNYTMQMSRRLWESNRVMRNLNRAFGDATDMTEILQLQPQIQDKPDATALRLTRGDIVFEDVQFAYDDNGDKRLFNNLSLHVKPGEKVGLVGHSGGGKTTISMLLLRFMDIQGGKILIDGQDISNVTQSSLRENIASVPQEPLLFHRSLSENIAYGRPESTEQEIKAIAKLAHADEFIRELPEAYQTLVGERGVKLSGGQRQRVAIARAMLKNAPILVLDEATSALDSESEALIQDALWKLMEGRTAIVIAHRLSTIQKMDRIIVMDKGRILEQGSHRELVRSGGVYASLWARQSGGFLEE